MYTSGAARAILAVISAISVRFSNEMRTDSSDLPQRWVKQPHLSKSILETVLGTDRFFYGCLGVTHGFPQRLLSIPGTFWPLATLQAVNETFEEIEGWKGELGGHD
jgi:hypothetical protein